mgnify:FL=1
MQQKSNNNHEIVWSPEKVRKIWDFYSKNLSQSQYFSYHSGKYIVDYIGRYLNIGSMESLLDFGCGPGYLIEHLLKSGGRGKVFGLDFSKEAVDQVNQKFNKHKYFGEAVRVDRLPSPFADNSMDVVISIEVVEHLNDEQLDGMMQEVARVLKPGGCFVVTAPNKEDLEANKTICPECGCIFHRWQHVRTWTPQTLEDRLTSSGFSIRLITDRGNLFPITRSPLA